MVSALLFAWISQWQLRDAPLVQYGYPKVSLYKNILIMGPRREMAGVADSVTVSNT